MRYIDIHEKFKGYKSGYEMYFINSSYNRVYLTYKRSERSDNLLLNDFLRRYFR